MPPIIPTPRELEQHSAECMENLLNHTHGLSLNGSNVAVVIGASLRSGSSYEKLMARGILCSEHAANVFLKTEVDIPKDIVRILLHRLSIKIGEYGEKPKYNNGPKEKMHKAAVLRALQNGKFDSFPNIKEMLSFETEYLEGKRTNLKVDEIEISAASKERLLKKKFWFGFNEVKCATNVTIETDVVAVLENRKRDLREKSVDILFDRLDGVKKEIAIKIMKDGKSETARPNIYRKAALALKH